MRLQKSSTFIHTPSWEASRSGTSSNLPGQKHEEGSSNSMQLPAASISAAGRAGAKRGWGPSVRPGAGPALCSPASCSCPCVPPPTCTSCFTSLVGSACAWRCPHADKNAHRSHRPTSQLPEAAAASRSCCAPAQVPVVKGSAAGRAFHCF